MLAYVASGDPDEGVYPGPTPEVGGVSSGRQTMRASRWVVVVVVAAFAAASLGCSAASLKSQKDGAWVFVPKALPDQHDWNGGGYNHPLRPAAFVLHPIGVALDYVVRPFYMLGGLAPEWFGLTVDDAQKFQAHHPEIVVPQNAPQVYD
jgi:hypothetical protein